MHVASYVYVATVLDVPFWKLTEAQTHVAWVYKHA